MANGTLKVSQVDVLTTSGTGTISIVPPATNTNRTLTLPDQTATIATLTTPSFATTIGVGAATASASGAGITFPATQSASTDANTLDDYEEGTWTPTITGSTSAPTGISYSTRTGTYTKIGNTVVVILDISGTISGAGSGNYQITGLPFTVSGTPVNGNGVGYVPASSYLYGVNSGTSLRVGKQTAGGGLTTVSWGDANVSAANFQIAQTLVYRV